MTARPVQILEQRQAALHVGKHAAREQLASLAATGKAALGLELTKKNLATLGLAVAKEDVRSAVSLLAGQSDDVRKAVAALFISDVKALTGEQQKALGWMKGRK